MIDYYKILNIPQNASHNDIKKAYRTLAKKYHPDNYEGSEEQASEHMSKINEAYDVLMDEAKRFSYDKSYKQQASNEKNTFDKNKSTYTSASGKQTTPPNAEPIFHEKSTISPQSKVRIKNGGANGCLSKIVKYCIYLVTAIFLINHFNLVDKVRTFIDKTEKTLDMEKRQNSDESPDGCICSYFNSLRESNTSAANKFVSDSSYKESTKTIVEIYQSIHKDDKYYSLFKEILNFNIHIDDINYNANKTKAVVTVTIQNIDCYGFMAFLSSSCNSVSAFESLSQKELNNRINKMMKNKKSYMTASVCLIEVVKTDKLWEISNIDDVNDMISILIGKIDLLANSIE